MTKLKKLRVKQHKVLAAYQNGSKETKDTLEGLYGSEVFNQDITDLVKTFDDALEVTGKTWCEPQGLTPDVIAYMKLKIIAEALNQGWIPDWTDSNQYKYNVWLTNYTAGVGFGTSDCANWSTCTTVGSRLCFKSGALAKYAGSQFRDLYNQYFN